MRTLICAAAATLALVGAAAADPQQSASPQARKQAISAERYASNADYVSRGHGYSARERRISACLAAYPTYNWRTDRIQVRPGVTRRCDL